MKIVYGAYQRRAKILTFEARRLRRELASAAEREKAVAEKIDQIDERLKEVEEPTRP